MEPDPEAVLLSQRLAGKIREEIISAGGAIPFVRYMAMALYEPGLGYYSAGQEKFGAAGDFTTAPEVSPLFGRCLARPCRQVLKQLGGGEILEFGAGSGALAADLLQELAQHDSLPERYLILEVSAELRLRQRETLEHRVPALAGRVHWLEELPASGFSGVILANEVLDAMPVHRFRWSGEVVEEYSVGYQEDEFTWKLQPPADAGFIDYVTGLVKEYALGPGYVSEVCMAIKPWISTLAERLAGGLVLLIDYGYPRREYYHPQRSGGTLMCHYRHRAHDDPLVLPGLQDITAHVDFTSVAEAGIAAGLELEGFTTQAHFLLDSGIDRMLGEQNTEITSAQLMDIQQARTLLMPGGMGERFRFIGLGRGLELPVEGFRMQDLRGRL